MTIPELARGLGSPGVRPIADDNFKYLYLFKIQSKDATPQLNLLSQDN